MESRAGEMTCSWSHSESVLSTTSCNSQSSFYLTPLPPHNTQGKWLSQLQFPNEETYIEQFSALFAESHTINEQ